MTQRDAFISVIHKACATNPDIRFITVDFGAPKLDDLRRDFPQNYIHAGISEQNAVNVASGLALAGKRVYVYMMAPFFVRAHEQIKNANIMQLPITFVMVGVGLGYAGAGPTHYSLEDMAVFRPLPNVEIFTAADDVTAAAIATYSLTSNKMIFVRLERDEMPRLYTAVELDKGYAITREKWNEPCAVACGKLVHILISRGYAVCDIMRVKPFPVQALIALQEQNAVNVFEEHYPEGGLGSALLEASIRTGIPLKVNHRAMPERIVTENGTREQLMEAIWK